MSLFSNFTSLFFCIHIFCIKVPLDALDKACKIIWKIHSIPNKKYGTFFLKKKVLKWDKYCYIFYFSQIIFFVATLGDFVQNSNIFNIFHRSEPRDPDPYPKQRHCR